MSYTSTHTHGSQEHVEAMVAALPVHYPMTLTKNDMEAFIWALAVAEGGVSLPEPDEAHIMECNGDDCVPSRISGLLSSLSETLGVEGV